MKDKGAKSLDSQKYEEKRGEDSPPRRLKSVDIADYKCFEEEHQRTTQLVFSYKGGKKVPKLKEPRNLYALSTAGNAHQPPKWPTELKVLKTRPRFIEYVPKNPEPFWKPDKTRPELPQRKLPVDTGRVVFDNPQGAEKYFMRSKAGGNVTEKPFYNLQSSDDHTLLFESRFESGNLKRAIQIGDYEYQLWMKTDQYTIKHTQWFYFRVKNTRAGVNYRFTIMNFIKSGSLYNDGMRPIVYSEMSAYKNKIGWFRTGDNVKYHKNDIRREDSTKDRYHYSLTWTCQFQYANDTCYFAHCYPYTYSDLQEYLQGIRNDPVKSRICKQRVLCRTLAGNFVYILTVTNPSKRPSDAEAKRAVVVTARVHPGETNSSWMMKGLLDFLTSTSPDAKLLRDTFIFKIVPMINPDGVIIGNYRCSLAGRDLNRNYKTMLKDSFPPIWHVRNMIKKLLEEREITVYCDFHGHSRKQNVFMYGCDNRNNPLKRLQERVFPTMMSRNAPCKFSYKGCKFKVQKSKEGTGRIVMWQLGILNSFTMEATFCGSSLGQRDGFHFHTVDLEAMGYHFCDTLLDFCDPDDSKYIAILRDLEQKLREEILAKMKKKGTAAPNMSLSDVDLDANYTSGIESSTGGSDSSVSDGLPMHLIYAPRPMNYNQHSRKKKLRTRKERNKRRAKAMKIKDVLITDVPKNEPEMPTTVKLSYKQGKRSSINSAARARLENPRHRKHEHHDSCRPFTPVHLCRAHSDKGPDYLEAVTNAYMLNGVLVNESSSAEVPHFRYTAGSNYLNEVPHDKRDSISRWSTHSSVLAQAIEQSSEENNFTVGYLSRQLEKNSDCTDLRGHETQSLSRLGSGALDLARKITMYNSRYKMEAAAQQHMSDGQAPVLKPRSPPSSPPNYPWRPRGTCLSSTKAQLHRQPKGQVSDLRKSMSQISLIDNNKASKNVLASASGSWMDMSDYTPNKAKISRQPRQEKAVLHRGRPDLGEPTKRPPNWEVQTAKVEGMFDTEGTRRAMKKYTSNGNGAPQATQDMAITGFGDTKSSKTGRPNPPMKSITSISAAFARNSPVYVTLPVDRPPVQVKPSPHRMHDAGTPEEFADEPGKLVSYALKKQREEAKQGKVYDSSPTDSDGAGPFVSQFSRIKETSPRREVNMASQVISPDSVENGHVHRVSSNKHSTKKTSPVAAGVVQIGAGMEDEFCLTGDVRKPRRRHKPSKKEPQSPTRNLDAAAAPSTISLTFKTDGPQPHELNPPPPPRLGAFAPQLKHFYKPTHR